MVLDSIVRASTVRFKLEFNNVQPVELPTLPSL